MIRLALARSGALAIELRPLATAPDEPVEVAIAPLPVSPDDFRLRHKTSDRAFYDEARAASGAFEIVFADREGFLTEGSFTSLFVERGGMLLTPPLARGLLPGVLRARLLDEGRAKEADLTEADLAEGFLIGNAVRGLVRARLRSAGAGSGHEARPTRLSRLRRRGDGRRRRRHLARPRGRRASPAASPIA